MYTSENKIPKVPYWLLKKICLFGVQEGYAGDIEEEFEEVALRDGRKKAVLWIWFYTLTSIPKTLQLALFSGGMMFKNYLKIALRNMNKHKGYSFINITGLAIGLAAFILIALYVQYELSFDRYHEHADRIYRVVREKPSSTSTAFIKTAVTPAPLGPALRDEFPEIESVNRMIKSLNILLSFGHEQFLEENFYWADPETFELFSIPFVKGDPQTALNDPSAIVLSEKIAKKYFGNEDPVGKVLTVDERWDFKVTGVFSNMPANSHFIMEAIVPYETYFRLRGIDLTQWGGNFSYTYFLLREGGDTEALQSKLPAFLDKYIYDQFDFEVEDRFKNRILIQPLTKIHLHSHRNQELEMNNDMIVVILFSSIALLFLFIACINYMNLATARSGHRSREVGIRKVMGAQRRQLIKQFFGESIATTVLAMIISIVIVLVALPAFNNLMERQLTFNPFNNPQLLLGLILLTLFVGLFSGIYPALYISGFRPIVVLSGTFTKSSKGLAQRNILVLIQFSITIIFVVFTFIVRDQLNFMMNRDMGYGRDQIVTLKVEDRNFRRNIQAIKTELLNHPDIVAVTTSFSLPNNIDYHTTARWPGMNPDVLIPIYYEMADYDFVDVFDIKIVDGRNFSRDFPSDENGVFLVNEAAVKAAGWESPVGRELVHWTGKTGKIVGIMKDFHMHSLHRPIEPLYILLEPDTFSYISLKIRPTHIPATINYVERIMKQFSPSYPFDYAFFDDIFERDYHTEQRMRAIFGSFSVLALVVACLGLFGLASFAIEQRTKEIGIRKLLGASVSGIFVLLSREFLKWVLLSVFIAWPVSYFLMRRWLSDFAYRIDMGVDAFFLSGGLVLIIALLTVSFQSVKAASSSPAESLKYE